MSQSPQSNYNPLVLGSALGEGTEHHDGDADGHGDIGMKGKGEDYGGLHIVSSPSSTVVPLPSGSGIPQSQSQTQGFIPTTTSTTSASASTSTSATGSRGPGTGASNAAATVIGTGTAQHPIMPRMQTAPAPGGAIAIPSPNGITHSDSETESSSATLNGNGVTSAGNGAGIGLPGHGEEDSHHNLNEKTDGAPTNFPPSTLPPKRIERTATGTQVQHNTMTTTGKETVRGFGMVPITRQMSTPPSVSPWGGVAPCGPDAMEGLMAVRSHEEEEEREIERQKEGPDPYAVRFEPGESINPKNWGVGYRWWLTSLAGLFVLNSTFASSSPSGIVEPMIEYFHFSQEVAVLTISLFVAGYCVGPLLWGPLSESYGRRPIFIITFVVYTGFQVGCALSKNTASILIFRFLGGTFASAPLTNSGALLADIWDGDHRGQAMSLFSLAPFAGPSIGPIVAGFIQVTHTDWRWVFWILAIFAGVCLGLIVFCIPETYAPTILVQKAKRTRKETGDDKYYAPLEKASHKLSARLNDILLKPFVMLAREPMLQAVTLYMSFVYGVVYLLFEAYPFVFIMNHGFNTGEEGLAFLGFFGGGTTAVIFFVTVIEPRYQRHAAKLAPEPPKPEKRLELCVLAGWSMVVAMFWFGWTSYSSIHWISPVLAGGLLGFAVLGMFVSLFNYIIDVYLWAAASALAVTTVVRSMFGAAFPLFATQMYAKLGTQWASSLLGFLALLMAPIPMVLMKYGATLRARSKYSPVKAG